MIRLTVEVSIEQARDLLDFLEKDNVLVVKEDGTLDTVRVNLKGITELTPPPPPAVEDEEPQGDGSGLDSAGVPWDERIHASTKTKVADGTWKKKRGITPAYYDSIVATLKGTTPEPTVVLPPPPPAPEPEQTVVLPPPPPPAVEIDTFAEFDAKVLAYIASAESTQGKLDRVTALNKILAELGHKNRNELKGKPDSQLYVLTVLGI
jgi:hypothetical protein